MICVSTIEPLIRYRIVGELVEMKLAAGEWEVVDFAPAQVREAVQAGKLKEVESI